MVCTWSLRIHWIQYQALVRAQLWSWAQWVQPVKLAVFRTHCSAIRQSALHSQYDLKYNVYGFYDYVCYSVVYIVFFLYCGTDVGDESRYKSLVSEVADNVGDEGLNVLFHNAAVLLDNFGVEGLTSDSMIHNFRVNTVAPMMFTKVRHVFTSL